MVLFVNKAAKALHIRESAEFSMSFDSLDSNKFGFD